MNAEIARHGIGGNKPPVTELLGTAYADLVTRIKAAIESAGRAPAVIEDDATLGKFADTVKYIAKLEREVEDARKSEKEPYLQGGRDVDAFFAGCTGELTAAKKVIAGRHTDYLVKKEAAERAAREEAARLARAEEEVRLKAAQEAEAAGRADEAQEQLETAAQAEVAAVKAEAEAHAKPADLVRTYSTGGSLSSLKKEWTFAIEDMAKVDASAVWPYVAAADKEKAIRAFVKAGGRSLAGVRVYEAAKGMVR